MYHYARALEVATQAGDAYLQALALSYAELATVEHGHPGDGLKMLQFAQVKAWDLAPDDERVVAPGVGTRSAVQACALVDSVSGVPRAQEVLRTDLRRRPQMHKDSGVVVAALVAPGELVYMHGLTLRVPDPGDIHLVGQPQGFGDFLASSSGLTDTLRSLARWTTEQLAHPSRVAGPHHRDGSQLQEAAVYVKALRRPIG